MMAAAGGVWWCVRVFVSLSDEQRLLVSWIAWLTGGHIASAGNGNGLQGKPLVTLAHTRGARRSPVARLAHGGLAARQRSVL